MGKVRLTEIDMGKTTNKETLFTLTTLGLRDSKKDDLFKDFPAIRSRTVGVYRALEDAEEPLKENWGDLNEAGYYPCAVIERITTGLYPMSTVVNVWAYERGKEEYGRGGAWHLLEDSPEWIKQWLQEVTGFCSIG